MPHELLVPEAVLSEEPRSHLSSCEGPTLHANVSKLNRLTLRLSAILWRSRPTRRSDLSTLPRRANAAFKVRKAKRLEVIVRLQAKLEEAIAAGIEVPSLTLDSRLGEIATEDLISHANADLTKLLQLNLGKPGELGEPIRWNDPRLGPLWPDGPPPWYVEAEKQLRELENRIADLPTPGRAPIAPSVLAQLATIRWLDKQFDLGVLDKYMGQYVLAANEQILAHGTYLGKVRKAAEKKAKALQIPSEVIAVYSVPSA